MTERQHLISQLMAHEGLRLKPYTDAVGKLTIGVGRNLTDKGLSSQEAMLLLDHDVDEAVTDCATFPWFVTLDSVRQRAIVDLRFNLGPGGFRLFKHLIAAMAQQDYTRAARELVASKWFGQVGPTRAAHLRAMLETGVDDEQLD